MYSYIYDIFTSKKKYEKQLLKIEGMLTDLGIIGKTYKLNVLKNLRDIIDETLSCEVKNIIAVGNDQTVSKLANLIVNKNVVLGIIPVGEPNVLAKALGIQSAKEACQIISARNIIQLDIGKANGHYFLLSIESNNKNTIFDFKDYNINPLASNEAMGIFNINIDNQNFKSDPCDGIMEAVFKPKQTTWLNKILKFNKQQLSCRLSVFPVKKLLIKHKKKPIAISVDRQQLLKTPLKIEVLPKKLKVIAGKQRIFS